MDSYMELGLRGAIEAPLLTSTGFDTGLDGVVLEIDFSDPGGGEVWIQLNQADTAARGVNLDPFVFSVCGDLWFQAWGDGMTMTVAASANGLEVAVGFVRGFLAGHPNEGTGSSDPKDSQGS